MDVFIYITFTEEAESLVQYMPDSIEVGFTWKTIQECGHKRPPASVISIRTQSWIPGPWAKDLSAILTRSTGYDHILTFLQKSSIDIPCGHLPP